MSGVVERTFHMTVHAVLGTLGFVYIFVPIVLLARPQILESFVFMNFFRNPFNNYTDLRAAGVQNPGRNFYIDSQRLRIGLWHVLPGGMELSTVESEKVAKAELRWRLAPHHSLWTKEDEFDRLLKDSDRPVILYLHGNSFTRLQWHRVDLYNLLSNLGYHVVTLDYRGFGDSEGSPTEVGVIADAIAAHKWLRDRITPDVPVIIWGHSLGTAIGTRVNQQLCDTSRCPAGLILEAPFNNLTEIVYHIPITRPLRWLPFFNWLMIRPLRVDFDMDMNTDENIRHVHNPILILHAHDDEIVPFQLAEKLHQAALEHSREVKFVEFESKFGYGHKYICDAPEMPQLVKEFVGKCLNSYA